MGYSGIQIEQILLHIILVVHRVACSVVRSSGTVRLARPPLRWQKRGVGMKERWESPCISRFGFSIPPGTGHPTYAYRPVVSSPMIGCPCEHLFSC